MFNFDQYLILFGGWFARIYGIYYFWGFSGMDMRLNMNFDFSIQF